jgi:hypothetical protein
MGINISTFSITARNESDPPMANDPVSPIKAFAGNILYMRKPSKHPIIIRQNICTSELSDTRKKKKYEGIATTPKRPSKPSVKLMAFAEPTTNKVMTWHITPLEVPRKYFYKYECWYQRLDCLSRRKAKHQ